MAVLESEVLVVIAFGEKMAHPSSSSSPVWAVVGLESLDGGWLQPGPLFQSSKPVPPPLGHWLAACSGSATVLGCRKK